MYVVMYLWVFVRRRHGGGAVDAQLGFFRPFLDFLPEVGMNFVDTFVPPYFVHGAFKSQGPTAK